MKLTAKTLDDEFKKMLVMRPIAKANPQKEALVFEDFERITEHWEEEPFKQACFDVRKQGGFFPSIKEIESAYWQAVKDTNGHHSDQDDLEKDHRRRMREHNETWAKLSCSKDLPWITEQATDEIDVVLNRLDEKTEESLGGMWSAAGQLHHILKRHREESIRGRACEIWKESLKETP